MLYIASWRRERPGSIYVTFLPVPLDLRVASRTGENACPTLTKPQTGADPRYNLWAAARIEHFLLTIGYVLFFLIHILQVSRAGWNNLRSMITGYEVVSADERTQ